MKCRNCKHPRWAEEHPGRPFFGWCDEVNDSPDMDVERECKCFEPATNADRFRAMSDEGLAKFLTNWDFCSYVCSQQYTDSPYKDKCPGNCKEQALEWLQQPAEEET